MGRPAGHRARQAGAQARRPDRPAFARDRPDRDQRLRPGDRPDRQAADPACGRQLLLLRRDVHPGRRPHLPHAHPPQLHPVPPGGRVRPDQPLERALHDRHLEGRALPGLGQHRGAEDERAVAADGRPPRRAGAGGRHPGRRAQPRARLWQGRGRTAVPAPRCARHQFHRLHRHRQPHRAGRRAEEVQHGARRQEPLRDL